MVGLLYGRGDGALASAVVWLGAWLRAWAVRARPAVTDGRTGRCRAMSSEWGIVIVTALLPFAAWACCSGLARSGAARRAARQIMLTDAIHRELGAVAAPEVRGAGPGLDGVDAAAASPRGDGGRHHPDHPRSLPSARPRGSATAASGADPAGLRPWDRARMTGTRPAGRSAQPGGLGKESGSWTSISTRSRRSPRSRLADLRAAGARAALIASARVGPRGVGPAVGAALIRLGHWLAAGGGRHGAECRGASRPLK